MQDAGLTRPHRHPAVVDVKILLVAAHGIWGLSHARGVLLDERTILTTAHCMVQFEGSKIKKIEVYTADVSIC